MSSRLLRGGFLAWLGAATVSAIGDGIFYFALSWTASGLGAGVVTAVMVAGLAPPLLLTLVGGASADRWGLRRTIIACDIAMCVLLAGYLVLARFVPVSAAVLVALSLSRGVVGSFRRPADNAFPRLFFPESGVARAMSLTGSAMEVARMAGPPLGAVVVAISFNWAMLADLASFVGVLAVLLVVRPPYEPPRAEGRSGSLELRAGLRAVRSVPGVVAMLCAVGIVAGSVLPMLGLAVPLLARSRGWSVGDAGLMEAFWIVGALAVSLVVAKWGTYGRPAVLLVGGPLLAAAGVVVAALVPVAYLAFAGTWVMGIGTALFTSHLFPLYLLRTSPGMLARFQSVLIVAQMLMMLLGNLLLGTLASQLSPATAMLTAAALCALAGAPILLSRTLRLSGSELDDVGDQGTLVPDLAERGGSDRAGQGPGEVGASDRDES